MHLLTPILLISVFSLSLACLSGSCSQSMCSDLPSDGQYYLTSFCDSEVACGGFSGDCNEYFSAGYKRFGCGSTITCCVDSKCLNLKVIDGGPNCAVEDQAGKQIVDASPSSCQYFTGGTSCGWSDRFVVTCRANRRAIVAAEDFFLGEGRRNVPLGPCSHNREYRERFGVPDCGVEAEMFERNYLEI